MRYLYLMLLLISNVWGGVSSPIVCPIDKFKDFEIYSKQEVEIKLPEKFIIGINEIEISISNPDLPSGYMISAFVDVEEFGNNQEPEIEDGYPISTIEIFENGKYKFELKVNIIYKSS